MNAMATYIYLDSNTNRMPDLVIQGNQELPKILHLSSGYQNAGFGAPNPPVTYEKVSDEVRLMRGSETTQEVGSFYRIYQYKEVR